ncbi:hypothetical protein [Anabaenopsis arnoldii]|uniref:Uncharacterized protein n=1 Tax=Anabaenopsis arnoldii TaxID=2152938 RepID=A0ABT5AUX0_9CYAN|nr:hypothetical protein [Anabaenopsis arnoldii]MDB9540140.1 hypothetical protein [Anabaenopsis arnoldii]MDH6092534.1 hypothetical protein [Anabaenopsis arnoldii]
MDCIIIISLALNPQTIPKLELRGDKITGDLWDGVQDTGFLRSLEFVWDNLVSEVGDMLHKPLRPFAPTFAPLCVEQQI